MAGWPTAATRRDQLPCWSRLDMSAQGLRRVHSHRDRPPTDRAQRDVQIYNVSSRGELL